MRERVLPRIFAAHEGAGCSVTTIAGRHQEQQHQGRQPENRRPLLLPVSAIHDTQPVRENDCRQYFNAEPNHTSFEVPAVSCEVCDWLTIKKPV